MIYTELSLLETAITGLNRYKKVSLGSDFVINKSNLPLCIIIPGSGNIEDYVLGNYQLDIITLFHDNRDIEKVKLEDMEQMIDDLESFDSLRLVDPSFAFDNEAFNIFGVEIPILAPYGAYRLTYDVDFSNK